MNSELYAGARTQEGGSKLVFLNVNNLRLFVYLLVCVKNPAQMKEEEPIKKIKVFFHLSKRNLWLSNLLWNLYPGRSSAKKFDVSPPLGNTLGKKKRHVSKRYIHNYIITTEVWATVLRFFYERDVTIITSVLIPNLIYMEIKLPFIPSIIRSIPWIILQLLIEELWFGKVQDSNFKFKSLENEISPTGRQF